MEDTSNAQTYGEVRVLRRGLDLLVQIGPGEAVGAVSAAAPGELVDRRRRVFAEVGPACAVPKLAHRR